MISIHDFKTSKLKSYYGSSKKVYRKAHVEKLLRMWADLHHLGELYTRTRLVPCNDDFLQKKAIPHFNEQLKKLKVAYPNIKEFHSHNFINQK